MTSNQIAYAVHRETVRHNLAMEVETARYQKAQNQLGFGNLSEAVRHNTEVERVNWYSAQSSARYQTGMVAASQAQAAASQQQAVAAKASAAAAQSNAAANWQNAETRRLEFGYTSEMMPYAQQSSNANYMNAAANLANARSNAYSKQDTQTYLDLKYLGWKDPAGTVVSQGRATPAEHAVQAATQWLSNLSIGLHN